MNVEKNNYSTLCHETVSTGADRCAGQQMRSSMAVEAPPSNETQVIINWNDPLNHLVSHPVNFASMAAEAAGRIKL